MKKIRQIRIKYMKLVPNRLGLLSLSKVLYGYDICV